MPAEYRRSQGPVTSASPVFATEPVTVGPVSATVLAGRRARDYARRTIASRAVMLRFVQLLAVLALALPASARADGAFPDSLGIFLPADRPHEIFAATNFGLLISDDDGATWRWVCEEAIGPYASPYQLGPPPDDRIMAVHYQGLAVSADLGCTWQAGTGPFEVLNDVFPDPSDPLHVLVTGHASPAEGEPSTGALLSSTDGGATFGPPTFLCPDGAYLAGVEIARSDPSIVYLAMYGEPPGHAVLQRSSDGGNEWEAFDLSDALGAPIARIIAVDAVNPDLLYLRMQDVGSEQLVIYDHQTGESRVALEIAVPMTAFLKRSDGALIVGARDGAAYLSEDDGESFDVWEGAPRFRALGERDGIVYAVADNFQDGFAVGASHDMGETWEPLLRFDEIAGPMQCGDVPTTCAAPWENLKILFGIEEGGDGDADADDGGTGDDTGAGDADDGCGCRFPGRTGGPAGAGMIALALALAVLTARRLR